MIPTGPGEQRGGARVARSWLRMLGRAMLVACLWLGLASAAAGAELGEADKAAVARIAAYLNDVRSLKARFIQVGPNGELAQGDLYLRRPGRLRFEYDPPSPLLLVADGFWLILQDKELEQVSRWPVNDTPLGVLVADDIELDGQRTRVTEVGRRAGVLTVTLIDRERPDEGSVTLVFSDSPLRLRQWRIVDAQGGVTNLSLQRIQLNPKLDPELFVFTDPEETYDR